MHITNYILSKTSRLSKQPEVTPGNHGFEMFNDAGTEIEVSEFLYSFVRMIKPNEILETGTHIGVSATFMGMALKNNGKGTLNTFEIIPQHFENSKLLFNDVGVNKHVIPHLLPAIQFDFAHLTLDMLFLDSEPQLRFDEFLKFWPALRAGGFIVIHDLHASLGHHGQTWHGVYDWPYGDFRKKLGPYIQNHMVQTITFPTPRGLTIFQKEDASFAFSNYLKGNLND